MKSTEHIKLKSDFCILGSGPVALILAQLLKSKGITPIIVSKESWGLLKPMRIENKSINLVPIFPHRNSNVLKLLKYPDLYRAPILKIKYFENVSDQCIYNFPEEKVPDFISNDRELYARYKVTLIKHLGREIFKKNIDELHAKVNRQYRSNHNIQRLGFIDGVSCFYHALNKFNNDYIKEDIIKINLNQKKIITNNSIIKYKHLFSTIPIIDFFSLCRISIDFDFYSESAKLYLLRPDKKIRNYNTIIYDLKLDSPIYRIFNPTKEYIIVHLARDKWDNNISKVILRTKKLLNIPWKVEFISEKIIKNCYPLGVSNNKKKNYFIKELASQNTYLFGRQGAWEYKDLDELNWELFHETNFN